MPESLTVRQIRTHMTGAAAPRGGLIPMKRLLLAPLLLTLLVGCSNTNKKELMEKYPIGERVSGKYFDYRFI